MPYFPVSFECQKAYIKTFQHKAQTPKWVEKLIHRTTIKMNWRTLFKLSILHLLLQFSEENRNTTSFLFLFIICSTNPRLQKLLLRFLFEIYPIKVIRDSVIYFDCLYFFLFVELYSQKFCNKSTDMLLSLLLRLDINFPRRN